MFSLGRSVDIKNSSNRWLVIISFLVASVMAFFLMNLIDGLLIAFGFFLCWALAREIDPKYENAAFVAAFIFLGSTFLINDGLQIALLLWLLLAIRFISKICGKIPTLFDVITVVGFSAYLGYAFLSPLFLLLSFLMLIFAWIRYGRAKLYISSAIVVLFLLVMISLIIPWQFSELFYLMMVDIKIFILWLISILILFYFQMQVLSWNKTYEDDLGGSLEYNWLQLALVFYGVALIGIILFVNISYSSLSLLLATIIGVNLHALYIVFNK